MRCRVAWAAMKGCMGVALFLAVMCLWTACGQGSGSPLEPERQQDVEVLQENAPSQKADPLSGRDGTWVDGRPYAPDTNLELVADSVRLACLPVMECYSMLYKGNRVVVAETALHPTDSVCPVWVKLAHSQEIQGWVPEQVLMRDFVPADVIAQSIYLWGHTWRAAALVLVACAVVWQAVAGWWRRCSRRQMLRGMFGRTGAFYPLLLLFSFAFCATAYATLVRWAPDAWLRYYFCPKLAPWDVPWPVAPLVCGWWLVLLSWLALADVAFRCLSLPEAVGCLLRWLSAGVLCYVLFLWGTWSYVGYLLWPLWGWLVWRREDVSACGLFLFSVFDTPRH